MNIDIPKDWIEVDGSSRAKWAQKAFKTACGEKTATVYFYEGDQNVVLNGVYNSEGGNVLEPAIALIPLDANDEAIKEATAQFFADVERRIDASYARGLYIRAGIDIGVIEPPLPLRALLPTAL